MSEVCGIGLGACQFQEGGEGEKGEGEFENQTAIGTDPRQLDNSDIGKRRKGYMMMLMIDDILTK